MRLSTFCGLHRDVRNTYVCTYIYIFLYVHMYTNMQTYMFTYTCMYMYMCIYIHNQRWINGLISIISIILYVKMTADIMWIHRVSFMTNSIDHRLNIIFFLMAIDLDQNYLESINNRYRFYQCFFSHQYPPVFTSSCVVGATVPDWFRLGVKHCTVLLYLSDLSVNLRKKVREITMGNSPFRGLLPYTLR